MAVVRLRPYGAALKDGWIHFPTGGELSARTNKNKTSAETPGTTEGIEALTESLNAEVKAGVSAAPYKLPEGEKVLKAVLWVYARAGTASENITVFGIAASAGLSLVISTTTYEWHSAEMSAGNLEKLTAKMLEEAVLQETSKKTVATADKLVEWHIELETGAAPSTKVAFSGRIKLQGQPKASQAQAVASSGKVQLRGVSEVVQRQGASMAGRIALQGVQAPVQRQAATAKAQIRLQGGPQPSQRQAVAASATVALKGEFQPTQTQAVTGQSQIRVEGEQFIAQRVLVAAMAQIRLAGAFTIQGGTAAAKRVASRFLFWFEEEDI